MALTSRLKPEGSLMLSAATIAVVYATYEHMLPTVVEHRMGGQNDPSAAAAERAATWTSIAVVSGIALLSKDATVFILGGVATVTLAWLHKHANSVSPLTQLATTGAAVDQAASTAAVDAVSGYDDSMALAY